MKNSKLIFFTALFLHFTFFILHSPLASAQTATDSSQGLRDSVKQKVADELAQIKKAVSKKAFLGTVTAINEANLTINNYLNQTRNVLFTASTTVKLKNGSEGTVSDLKVGNYLLVMGDVDSAGTMTTTRLLVIDIPLAEKRLAASGTVTAVGSAFAITTSTDEKFAAKLASDTYVTTLKAGKTTKLKVADIKVGSRVVLITRSGAGSVVTDVFIFPAAPVTP